MATIGELVIGDDPQVWRDLGFTVEGDALLSSGIVHRLNPSVGRGLRAWALDDLDVVGDTLDGVPTTTGVARVHGTEPEHPNGVVAVDHVVLATPNLPRTMAALEAAGLERRRLRDAGNGLEQAFYRLGPLVLEVAGAATPDPATADRPARFFGIAYTVADLAAPAALLGDRLHPAKDAVQPGRRIATLDRSAGASTAIAFMSPGDLSD